MPLTLPFHSLYDVLTTHYARVSPAVWLVFVGAVVLGAAFLFRAVVLTGIHTTRETALTARWRQVDEACGWAAGVAGLLVGLLCFGAPVSAVLCGGCFYLLSIGAVFQGLEDNARRRQAGI